MNENGRPSPTVGREVNSAFEEEGEEASPRVGEFREGEENSHPLSAS